MITMFKRIIVGLTVAAIALSVSACAPAEPTTVQETTYSDANADDMKRDIEITVCNVAGKTVMDQEDVDSFLLLSRNLRTYEGEKRESALDVANILESIATDWSIALNTDLGEENGQMLTDLCEQVKGV